MVSARGLLSVSRTLSLGCPDPLELSTKQNSQVCGVLAEKTAKFGQGTLAKPERGVNCSEAHVQAIGRSEGGDSVRTERSGHSGSGGVVAE